MKGELIVNGYDAWTEYKVNMGDGFLSQLATPAQMKDYIESTSRNEDGTRMVVIPKLSSRELSLPFTIMGADAKEFLSNKAKFEEVLNKGNIVIRVPGYDDKKYKLVYTGKSVSYSMNKWRTFATLSAKFIEPNPTDRE